MVAAAAAAATLTATLTCLAALAGLQGPAAIEDGLQKLYGNIILQDNRATLSQPYYPYPSVYAASTPFAVQQRQLPFNAAEIGLPRQSGRPVVHPMGYYQNLPGSSLTLAAQSLSLSALHRCNDNSFLPLLCLCRCLCRCLCLCLCLCLCRCLSLCLCLCLYLEQSGMRSLGQHTWINRSRKGVLRGGNSLLRSFESFGSRRPVCPLLLPSSAFLQHSAGGAHRSMCSQG